MLLLLLLLTLLLKKLLLLLLHIITYYYYFFVFYYYYTTTNFATTTFNTNLCYHHPPPPFSPSRKCACHDCLFISMYLKQNNEGEGLSDPERCGCGTGMELTSNPIPDPRQKGEREKSCSYAVNLIVALEKATTIKTTKQRINMLILIR